MGAKLLVYCLQSSNQDQIQIFVFNQMLYRFLKIRTAGKKAQRPPVPL